MKWPCKSRFAILMFFTRSRGVTEMNSSQRVPLAELDEVVNRAVNETPVIDMHTHLYSQEFGDIGLWGIDELVNYHYLIAEVFRFSPISYASFWSMGKTAQADLIWKTLFHENSPISEATRGILTVLHGLGL